MTIKEKQEFNSRFDKLVSPYVNGYSQTTGILWTDDSGKIVVVQAFLDSLPVDVKTLVEHLVNDANSKGFSR